MNFKLTISYDGSSFSGWQTQPIERTIQSELERVICNTFNKDNIKLHGSGRTDSGVHAIGQVANFLINDTNMNSKQIMRAINSKIKKDIHILDCQKVDKNFHSRFSAVSREYIYKISTNFSPFSRKYTWYQNYNLDLEILKECSEIILGKHDFSNFCKATSLKKNNLCNIIKSSWNQLDDIIYFKVKSDRFLHHMVRMLVGTMLEVSKNRLSIQDFNNLLDKPNSNKRVITAPALGLYLLKVNY